MSYADITNPVIIQATASVSAKIDNFVRRYAIVSNGHTNINVGESAIVYQSDYNDYLKMGSDTDSILKDLKGFFAFAGPKELVLIEVGNEGATQEVKNLETFIASGLNRPYVTLCPSSWYNAKITNEQTITKISLQESSVTLGVGQTLTIIAPTDSNVANFSVSNSSSEILNSNKARANQSVFTAIKAGTATLTLSGDYKGIENLEPFTLEVNVVDMKKNTWNLEAIPTEAHTHFNGEITLQFPDNISGANWNVSVNGEDYISVDTESQQVTITAKEQAGTATILVTSPATNSYEMIQFSMDIVVAETDTNPSTNIQLSATETIAENPIQPEPLQAEIVQDNQGIQEQFNSAFANLCKMYPNANDARFFMCRITDGVSPANDTIWQNYKGTKSFFGVYDTLAIDAYSLCGAILGKMANSIFDITDSNPATPLNYKTISGATFKEYKEAFINSLTQAPVNYGYQLVGNPVILNGRYSDGYAWEYWYQWDTVCIEVEKKLATLLLNGVNNPNYVIQFNQNGIDILEAGIISVLKTYKNRGAITEFARSVDVGTNELIDIGYINAVKFYEFQANNKEKYENEICSFQYLSDLSVS